MSTPVIIFDSNAVAHACKWAYKGLSTDFQETGVIFGFFIRILECAKRFDTCRFVFAWDSKTSLRKKVYSAYKANRQDKDKTQADIAYDNLCYEQFELLQKELLPQFGFKNVYCFDGYEGDDLIASIVKGQDPFAHESEKTDFIVVGRDADLFQLLEHCRIYPMNKKQMLTKEWFIDTYDIEPAQWIMVKTLAGCSSDNITGIKGVAETTALKFLKGGLDEKSKVYQKIINGMEYANATYYPLVRLPYMNTPDIEIIYNERFLYKNFQAICDRYDFKSLLREYKLWDKYFHFR